MSTTRFESEFFAGNRRKLRELFTGTAPIVLAAHGQLQMSGDQAYPFRQDASFWYLTGIDEPDIVVVLDKDKEYLIVPARSEQRILFGGAIDEDALRRTSGVDTVLDEATGWKRLGGRLEGAKHVATLAALPAYVEKTGSYTNPARRRLIGRMKHYNDRLELLDLSQHLAKLRVVKQAAEIAAIKAAVDATAEALKSVSRTLKRERYANEYEVEADLDREFRRHGAQGHAFAPTVAGGPRACMLHYEQNDSPLTKGELLLCDVGALVDHYSADIARTFSVGPPGKRQQAVYDAVLEVSEFAVQQLRPGLMLQEYERSVRAFMGESLRELGLIKSISDETVAGFYPYATAHFLGLATHDVGDYDTPLEPGMVLALQPGMYIRSEGIGVRIEDNVLITADGYENLSAHIPKQLIRS